MRQVSAHSLASRSELRAFTFTLKKAHTTIHNSLFQLSYLFSRVLSCILCIKESLSSLLTGQPHIHTPSWPTNNLLRRPHHRNHHNHRKPDLKNPLLLQQNPQRHKTDNQKRRPNRQSRRSKNQTPRVLLQIWTPRSSRISI